MLEPYRGRVLDPCCGSGGNVRAVGGVRDRALTTAEIIAELVALVKEMRDADKRHEALGLSPAEAARYDAIVQNDASILELEQAELFSLAA